MTTRATSASRSRRTTAPSDRVRLGAKATCLLTAEEALLLADRLQRAAHLVLETDEDLPDPEREYRRYRGSEDPPGSVADMTG